MSRTSVKIIDLLCTIITTRASFANISYMGWQRILIQNVKEITVMLTPHKSSFTHSLGDVWRLRTRLHSAVAQSLRLVYLECYYKLYGCEHKSKASKCKQVYLAVVSCEKAAYRLKDDLFLANSCVKSCIRVYND